MAKFMQGLFWGAVFGGFAGLLNAPHKGEVTRTHVKNYLQQATDDVDDVRYKVDNLSHAIMRLKDEGLMSLKEATTDIQGAVEKFSQENQPRINRIQAKINQLESSIEEGTQAIQASAPTSSNDDK